MLEVYLCIIILFMISTVYKSLELIRELEQINTDNMFVIPRHSKFRGMTE